MYKELEQDDLKEKIANNDTVIVQYSASWCGNCRLMKPKFKRFSNENESWEFIMVDAEKFPESRQLATVNNLPTFAVFKNGVLIDQTQTNKADLLKKFIDETAHN